MRPSFKDFFYFNKVERRGVLVLLTLILLVIAANQLLIYYPMKGNQKYSEKEVRSLLSQLEREDSIHQSKSMQEAEKLEKSDPSNETLFPFNPNEASIAQWMKLGLSKKQAEVIKHYQEKGGVFRIKADVAKMYVISDERYEKLVPYILLPDQLPEKKKIKKEYSKKVYPEKKRKAAVVDINLADSIDLLKVYGIGPFYAGKIVNYRKQLGGYSSKKQLLEIWHFSDSMLAALDSKLKISSIKLRKLNVNVATAKELQQHPYISWNIANSIVNLRKQHGQYHTLEEIKRSVLIDDSTYAKISPYLKVE